MFSFSFWFFAYLQWFSVTSGENLILIVIQHDYWENSFGLCVPCYLCWMQYKSLLKWTQKKPYRKHLTFNLYMLHVYLYLTMFKTILKFELNKVRLLFNNSRSNLSCTPCQVYPISLDCFSETPWWHSLHLQSLKLNTIIIIIVVLSQSCLEDLLFFSVCDISIDRMVNSSFLLISRRTAAVVGSLLGT